MCPPPVVAAALAIASAAGSAYQMYQTNRVAKAEAGAARVASASDEAALEARQRELDAQTAGKAMEIQKEFIRQRGMLRVAQGESGLVGPTHFRELAAMSQEYTGELSTLEDNREAMSRQNARDFEKVNATYRARVNAARAGSYTGWAAGLQIGSSALQAGAAGYSAGKAWQK